jgi:glycosyltransferase involved in cell wall biosynthesis
MQRRILQVIGAMNPGGVETWLMNMLRAIDRDRFRIDFLVHKAEPAVHDQELLSLGSSIYRCLGTRNPFQYANNFSRIVRKHGPFDVVHSHVYWYSGFVMRLAARAGVPIRIAHSHTARKMTRSNVPRFAYEVLMRHWIARYSTHRLCISQVSGESLFEQKIRHTVQVLPYGLDFRRFMCQTDSRELKIRWNIPRGRSVIGHIGNFSPVKNHPFIVKMFDQVIARGVDAHLLLVGDGALREEIRSTLEERKLSDRCTFAGLQTNVAPFLNAMDIFVFPSFQEGLGIVALEAQAAAIPVIASPVIPKEIDVIPQLVQRIPLEDGAPAWASAVIEKLRNPPRRQGNEALRLQSSSFAIPVCLERLGRIYSGERIGA